MTASTFSAQRHLFLDPTAWEARGLRHTLNQPSKHPRNPLIVPDAPWETKEFLTRVTPWGTVLRQGDLFRLWYHIMYIPFPFVTEKQILVEGYATSRDGLTWDKPVLGLNQFMGSKENNVVAGSDGKWDWCHGATELDDPHESDPRRRYKMLACPNCVAASPDGVHWQRIGRDRTNFSDGFSQDTHHVFFWDEAIGRYRLYTRPEVGVRKIAMATSADFRQWEWHEPKVVLEPTSDELAGGGGFGGHALSGYYNMSVFPYEGFYLGLPVHLYKDEAVDVGFLWSRDGAEWRRPRCGRVFLPRGPAGSYDCGSVYPTSGLVSVGDELWLYYAGFTKRHTLQGIEPGEKDSSINLAVIRRDGFMSLDAGAEPGTVTTEPVEVTGEHLYVNAEASKGRVRAELLDEGGSRLGPFSADACRPAHGDAVRQILSWRTGSPGAIAGQMVRVRFCLENANLYSFWFE